MITLGCATQSLAVCLTQYGSDGAAVALSVTVDRATGDVAIVGSLNGTVDFGGGPLTAVGAPDMFVAKFDSRCRHLWSKSFGTVGEELFVDARFDPQSNLILAGNVRRGGADFGGGLLSSVGDYDIFLVKLARDGSHVWSKRYGDPLYQRVDEIDVDEDGDVVMVGTFSGDLDFGLGRLDGRMYVAKIDSSGEPVFSKAFKSLTDTAAQLRSVAVDHDGNIVVGGIFGGTIEFGGRVLTGSGRFGLSVVIAKFTPNGVLLWSNLYPAFGEKLSFARDGALYLWTTVPDGQSAQFGAVSVAGPGSVLTKISALGDHDWTRSFAGGVFWAAGTRTVAVTDFGHVVAVADGATTDFGSGPIASHGSTDIFLTEFDGAGHLICASAHGDEDHDGIASIATAGNEVAVTGEFTRSISFGARTLTAPGGGSVFLFIADSPACASVDSVPTFATSSLVLLALALLAAAVTRIR